MSSESASVRYVPIGQDQVTLHAAQVQTAVIGFFLFALAVGAILFYLMYRQTKEKQ